MLSTAASNALLEDARGAARPRRVRAGHHRAREGAAPPSAPGPSTSTSSCCPPTCWPTTSATSSPTPASTWARTQSSTWFGSVAVRPATRCPRSTRWRRRAASATRDRRPTTSSTPSAPATPPLPCSQSMPQCGRAAIPVCWPRRWSPRSARRSSWRWVPRQVACPTGRRRGPRPWPRRWDRPRSPGALEAVGTALVDMRQAPDPRIPLEVALVRLTRPDAGGDLDALVARIEQLERRRGGRLGARSRPGAGVHRRRTSGGRGATGRNTSDIRSDSGRGCGPRPARPEGGSGRAASRGRRSARVAPHARWGPSGPRGDPRPAGTGGAGPG